jgi:hypothetical protein
LRERNVPVRRNFEINSPIVRPDATVLYVAHQTLLIAIQIDNADALTAFWSAMATCIASVVLPEPPFSLPTTIT